MICPRCGQDLHFSIFIDGEPTAFSPVPGNAFQDHLFERKVLYNGYWTIGYSGGLDCIIMYSGVDYPLGLSFGSGEFFDKIDKLPCGCCYDCRCERLYGAKININTPKKKIVIDHITIKGY